LSAAQLADLAGDLAGVAMLLLGLLLPMQRRREAAARLVAWQGGLLALAAGAAALGGAGPYCWLMAFLALVVRALLLPERLRLAVGTDFARLRGAGASLDVGAFSLRGGGSSGPGGGGDVRPRAGGATLSGLGAVPSFLVGGGLAVLAFAAVTSAGAGMDAGTREGLALALATLLAGWLAILLGRGLPFGLVGLLAAENGALLGVVHAGGMFGLGAALAAVSPGLVACDLLAALRGRGHPLEALRKALRQ
jgi:hydrogenase-4 membrane subunit HyfE